MSLIRSELKQCATFLSLSHIRSLCDADHVHTGVRMHPRHTSYAALSLACIRNLCCSGRLGMLAPGDDTMPGAFGACAGNCQAPHRCFAVKPAAAAAQRHSRAAAAVARHAARPDVWETRMATSGNGRESDSTHAGPRGPGPRGLAAEAQDMPHSKPAAWHSSLALARILAGRASSVGDDENRHER